MEKKAVELAHKILTHNLVILLGGVLLALLVLASAN